MNGIAPKGEYPIGYGRPPEQGKIKKGEVRNPHGRNGKPKDDPDPFERVMARQSRVTIDGELFMISTTEAYYMKMAAMALQGNVGAARIVQEEFHRRRKAGPAPLSTAEIAQAEKEEAERRALSARLINMLEEEASAKKAGSPRMVYRDGKLIPMPRSQSPESTKEEDDSDDQPS
jgi:hypothetical protein